MPKAILEYNLPEELAEYETTMNAGKIFRDMNSKEYIMRGKNELGQDLFNTNDPSSIPESEE